ncbi:hypothetical protein ACFSO0_12740 [Brevibacillus sp. GCM10020057]|uniref:hypothetical protein n=1 Tax=Brevibacillus sp. GCM10020057 TaxID=3317327 RepID=UPI003644A08F
MSIITPQPNVVSITDYKQFATNVGTANEDWSDAIQRAVDAVTQKASNSSNGFESNIQGVVVFPIQRFKIRKPILLPPQGVVLTGTSISSVVLDDIYTGKFSFVPCTIIEKTTNATIGGKTRKARGGAVTDDYNVDAFFLVDHADNTTNYNTSLSNLTLYSTAPKHVRYGIYAPRTTHATFSNIQTYSCDYGFFTYDSWMTTIDRFYVRDCVSALCWQDDGTNNGTGTTLHASSVWANTAQVGFDITLLAYSTFTSCGVDHVRSGASRAYSFKKCNGITLNGCGAEDIKGDVLYFENTSGVVNGFYSYYLYGAPPSRGTSAIIYVTGNSRVVFNACRFPNYQTFDPADRTYSLTIANNFNQIVQNGANVVFHMCQLPTNGNPYVSYSNNSTGHYVDESGATTCINVGGVVYKGTMANGIKRLQGTAMPTAGNWKAGDIIENTAPVVKGNAGSKYIVLGWCRLTTGSSNVLNTDWVQMISYTGA